MKRFLLLFALLFATITWLQAGNEAHGATFTTELEEVATGPYNGAFKVDITFSKAVSAVSSDDVDLGGTANANDVTVAVTNVGSKPTKTWRATITPTRSGTLTMEIGGNAVQQGGDENALSNQLSVIIDMTAPTVTLSNLPTSHSGTPFDYTVTFSEDVTFESWVEGMVHYNVNGSGKVYTVTVELHLKPNYGVPTIAAKVPANQATDAAGNGNIASDKKLITIDNKKPTLISSGGPYFLHDRKEKEHWVWFTISDDVTVYDSADAENTDLIDIDTDDIILGGTATAKVLEVEMYEEDWEWDGAEIGVKIRCTTTGTITFSVAANTIRDRAGHGNSGDIVREYWMDPIPPTVTLDVPEGPQKGPFNITVTFNEYIRFFTADDIALDDGDAEATATVGDGQTDKGHWQAEYYSYIGRWPYGDGEVFPVTITPTSEGDLTIHVPKDGVEDRAANGNIASEKSTVTIDMTAPTVSITKVPTTAQKGTFPITVTFSEPVKDFTTDDVTINGKAEAKSVSANRDNSVYKVTIAPRASLAGEVTFQIAADVATDTAGNNNTASAVTTAVHVDTIVPTVETITGLPTTAQNAAFDITITFSEAMKDFTADDVTVRGKAEATAVSANAEKSVYTVTITPNATGSEGEVTFQVKADVATDNAGNGNTASAVTPAVPIDTLAPKAKITGVPQTEQNAPYDITITFDEVVNGFDVASDLTVTGEADVSLKNTVTPKQKFVVTIAPRANQEGDITVQVKADAVADVAGNSNAASAVTPAVHIDTIAPTVTLSAPPTSEQKGPFDLTITFSEAVKGFAVSDDLAIVGEADVSLKNAVTPRKKFTVAIAPRANQEGDVTVQVKADAVADLAGNNNAASAVTPAVPIDTLAPTVSITSVPTSEQKGPFDLTITFSEDVSGFAVPDALAIVGEAKATLKATDTPNRVWTVTITPNANQEGDVTVQVKADAVADLAGNNNAASAVTPPVHIDTIAPTVTMTGVPTEIQLEAFSVQIEFLEDVTEFALDDIAFSGDAVVGTAVLTPKSGEVYTLTITPHEDTDGNLIITVPAAVAKDAALNNNVASAPQTVPVAPAWIPEPNLRIAVRAALGLTEGEDFSQSKLSKLIDFTGASLEINTLTGLEHAINLTRLDLNNNGITVVDALTDMTALTVLVLRGNSIVDLTPLAGLTKLQTLDVSENAVVDVTPLVGLTNLVTLRVAGNPIEDLTPLVGLAKNVDITLPSVVADSGLKGALRTTLGVDETQQVTKTDLQNITTLNVKKSQITSLEGLEQATKLATLDLSGNSITDITRLKHLTGLTTLNLSGNNITDITPLAGLTKLTLLNLSGNNITDITPLEDLTNLTALDLSDNAIKDITPLEDLTALTALGLNNNPISSFVPVESLTSLTTLGLSGHAISDLNAISELTELHSLNLNDNAITSSSLNAITELTALTHLDLSENKVTSLTAVANFTELITLNLSDNNINDVSSLTALTALEYLYLDKNAIGDVGPLAGLATLKTLRLAENPILNTVPLYPLTQRASPVDIDITIAEYPPWDVNEDGEVNAADSALVTAALGQSGAGIVNSRTDVNGDGEVDNADLTLVTQHLDNNPGAAPAAMDTFALLDPATLDTLDRATLKATLDRLLAESDGSLKYLRAIQLLQNALAVLLPDETRLFANYPNPFNPETWIPYQLAKGGNVEIFIYDARGVLVRHLSLGHQRAGYYTEKSRAAYWDGRNTVGERVASGIYFYRLQADNASLLRKMLILK